MALANRENPRHELNAAATLQQIRANHDERPRFDSNISQALKRNVKNTTVIGQWHRFEHGISIMIAPQGRHGGKLANSNQGGGERNQPSHTQQSSFKDEAGGGELNIPRYQAEHPPGRGFGQEPKLVQGCGKAIVSETATIIETLSLIHI